jgi:hypothetical protein
MSDADIAAIGRDLAVALSQRARSRSVDDQKLVLQLQTDLCRAVFSEVEKSDQSSVEIRQDPG